MQLLSGVEAAAFASQPLPVKEVGPGELESQTGTSLPTTYQPSQFGTVRSMDPDLITPQNAALVLID